MGFQISIFGDSFKFKKMSFLMRIKEMELFCTQRIFGQNSMGTSMENNLKLNEMNVCMILIDTNVVREKGPNRDSNAVGLMGQLVKHCTGIAEVRFQISIQP